MNMKFLPKNKNFPNYPQIGLIEKFWAYLKRNVYGNGMEFNSWDQLISRIRYVLNNFEHFGFQRAIKNLPKTIRKGQREGPSNAFW